ncbi:MAG: tyrosine-protein phosphatase [Pseudomonadota bacterium]
MTTNLSRVFWALFFAAAAVHTLHAAPRVTDVTVSVADDRSTYSIVWTTEPAGAPVTIAVTESADGSGARKIAENAVDGRYQWHSIDSDKRHYFSLTPMAGEPVMAASRVLPLEGGRNFRDLGGYHTADGKRVKWGHVFRSGVMDGLTDADYDYLSSLGIRTICDFRAADERKSEPTDWRAGTIDYLTFPDPPEEEEGSGLLDALRKEGVTPEEVAQGMAAGYVGIAYQHAPAYREMFDRLAGGEIPLTFNCSAGKDRTGIAAALLLTVLGVPHSTIVSDYALSDDIVDYMAAFMSDDARAKAAERDSPYAFLMAMPPELVEPLMRSDEQYIESALTALADKHGSVMSFIQDDLDVTDAEIEAIRTALLF